MSSDRREGAKQARDAVPLVRAFRSTWVASSVRAIRGHGLLDAYASHISAVDRDALLYAVPGTWLPADLVVRHYRACDALALRESDIVANGASVTMHVQGTVLARIAQSVGVTPWTIFGQLDRLWERVMQGGGVAVTNLGPKEARVELLGFPLAPIRYNRIATRGILQSLTGVFCRRAFAREESALCGPTTLAYRVQWA